MKKLFLLCLSLVGCALPAEQSSNESDQNQSVEEEQKPEFSGHASSGDVCQGQKEVREFIVNGELYFIFIPILCNDQWEDPADPISQSLISNQEIINVE